MNPDRETAMQFAIMVTSGMPPDEALPYFYPADTPADELRRELKLWLKAPSIQAAVRAVQGKDWQGMSLDEKVRYAIEKHYAELAYFLYSRNYITLSQSDQRKADTARQVLEAKLAGMSGKMDALSQWFEDVRAGRVKLQGASLTATH
jgi:murein L,D-transpeptidase YcbB/YkuD